MATHHPSHASGGLRRRNWIAGTATTVGAAILSASPASRVSAQADASDSDAFIDAHVHVWTPDTESFPLDKRYTTDSMRPPSFTLDELSRHTSDANVGRVVLIQMSFYGFDNSYMLDVIEKHPGKFSGVAVIDENARPVETMKSLRAKGVRGFRIVSGKKDPSAWLSGEGMKQMWSCAADQAMAICPLINPEYIESVDTMCQAYPKTTVVVDHFARIGIDGTIRESDVDALCRLARHENVYVKTSAFYALGKKSKPYTDLGPMIHRLAHAFGTNRLMWASDCPYQVQGEHTYYDSIDLIRYKLDFLSNRDRQWMLRKTAEQVFFSA